jgi:hypothetical protein
MHGNGGDDCQYPRKEKGMRSLESDWVICQGRFGYDMDRGVCQGTGHRYGFTNSSNGSNVYHETSILQTEMDWQGARIHDR